MNLESFVANGQAAQRAAEEAIERVGAHNAEWCAQVERIVRIVAATRTDFTTDDIWSQPSIAECGEPRALGNVMKRLAQLGVIVKTGTYRKSGRAKCHGRDVAVWRLVR